MRFLKSRSGAAVEEYLAQYPDIAVVIDLHRDALGDGDVTYKTMAELDGQTSSQLMMLVGTGESWLSDLSDSDLHELFSLEREAVDNI